MGFDSPRTCFESGGRTRCFFTYVPWCAGKNSPLVYSLHGYTSNPLLDSLYSGWKIVAKKNCAVIVWPTGNVCEEYDEEPCWDVPGGVSGLDPRPSATTTECCCGLATPEDTKDLDFLRTVASYVVRDVPSRTLNRATIDTKRIYVAGHSNGCMTALAMAMTHSDLITSVCCHAGTLLTPPADDYVPVPVLLIHGSADNVVPYGGTTDPNNDLYFPGTVASFQRLSEINGCDKNAQAEIVDGGSVLTATGCTNNATVKLLTKDGDGHDPYAGRTTDKAWEFCSSHESAVKPVLDEIP